MSLSRRSGIAGRRGLWTAGLGQIICLLVFIALVAVLAPGARASTGGVGLIALGVIFALVPAVIWLAFFYQQDRLEPEPKSYVVKIFLLGGLLAKAVAIPLVDVFQIDRWLYTNVWIHLLGSILVVGVIQEFVKYAAVRYSVYDSAEFDERVDGVIYATAAGVGFAAVLNIEYVLRRGGVRLTFGAIRIVVAALAQASIAGIMGYFLGQAKFEHTSAYYLPSGLALCAVLNGVFFWAQDLVTVRGISVNPWYGLILAVVIAIGALAIVFWLIRRANAETLALSATGGAS
jgi:RsiW-degrading membrane proteinase PrsW (M82 family)